MNGIIGMTALTLETELTRQQRFVSAPALQLAGQLTIESNAEKTL